MIKTKGVSVTIYELKFGSKDNKLGVMAQFSLDGIRPERDENGLIKNEYRVALQKAFEEALSKWEF